MTLPCITCKLRTVRKEGFRTFYGCSDEQIKKENFVEDTWLYRHTCNAYESEDKQEEGNE